MQHVKLEVDFSKFEPFSEIKYDMTLATDPNKFNDLIRFIRTYYHVEDYSEDSAKNIKK